MDFEFPMVSQTRFKFWGVQQYTKDGMWWFTLLFGALGLHHIMLRSPHTWILFVVGNFFSLGYWWFYDLIQLSTALDYDHIHKYGIESPWGPFGIAQGMFIKQKVPGEKATTESSEPSKITISATVKAL